LGSWTNRQRAQQLLHHQQRREQQLAFGSGMGLGWDHHLLLLAQQAAEGFRLRFGAEQHSTRQYLEAQWSFGFQARATDYEPRAKAFDASGRQKCWRNPPDSLEHEPRVSNAGLQPA